MFISIPGAGRVRLTRVVALVKNGASWDVMLPPGDPIRPTVLTGEGFQEIQPHLADQKFAEVPGKDTWVNTAVIDHIMPGEHDTVSLRVGGTHFLNVDAAWATEVFK